MFLRPNASFQSGFCGRHQDGDPAPPDALRISLDESGTPGPK